MKFEELQYQWTLDCVIDETELSQESIKIPQLHNKYLIHYSSRMDLVDSTWRRTLSRRSRHTSPGGRDRLLRFGSELGAPPWHGVGPVRHSVHVIICPPRQHREVDTGRAASHATAGRKMLL